MCTTLNFDCTPFSNLSIVLSSDLRNAWFDGLHASGADREGMDQVRIWFAEKHRTLVNHGESVVEL